MNKILLVALTAISISSCHKTSSQSDQQSIDATNANVMEFISVSSIRDI